MMNPNIPIFPSTSITRPLGMHSNSVQRTEMTSYTSDLVLKDFMVETSFEFSLTSLGCSDITSFLSSSKNNL